MKCQRRMYGQQNLKWGGLSQSLNIKKSIDFYTIKYALKMFSTLTLIYYVWSCNKIETNGPSNSLPAAPKTVHNKWS